MRKSARHLETSDTPTRIAQPAAGAAPRMPLIRLTPHKARVVIEDGAEMILVLKVSLHRSDSVELASGGRMEALSGMLRIRERGGLLSRADGKINGKVTFVPETVSGNNRAPPEFQIDVPLGPREFRVLLDLGRAGRLPHKIFVQAGERTAVGPRGLIYRSRNGRTAKFWDNIGHRRLPVTNVTFVVPVESGQAPRSAQRPRREFEEFDDDRYDDRNERDTDRGVWNDGDDRDRPREQRSFASSAQVAELADELIVYQSETRHLLTALLIVVGLTAAIVVVAGVLRFLR
jgi:hypothetical protein